MVTAFMQREDLSDFLVHFIKGDTNEEAFGVLSLIVQQAGLLGGAGFIRAPCRCVCFSEAPIPVLANFLARYSVNRVRYRPFGVAVRKRWLFEQGGRPVIYGRESEYSALPEDFRWRHVRYEPDLEPPIDFTWEREWRIKTDRLGITPDVASLVLPDTSWADRVPRERRYQDPYASLYSEITGVPVEAWIDASLGSLRWAYLPLASLDSDRSPSFR
jgi:hypothetical protein